MGRLAPLFLAITLCTTGCPPPDYPGRGGSPRSDSWEPCPKDRCDHKVCAERWFELTVIRKQTENATKEEPLEDSRMRFSQHVRSTLKLPEDDSE